MITPRRCFRRCCCCCRRRCCHCFHLRLRCLRRPAHADVERVIWARTGAIIVEPVQGESGIHCATPAFVAGLRRLAAAHGALLIVDEVQCGLGRTGRLWAHEAYGDDCAPDMMTLAKPMAGAAPSW